MIMVFSIVCMFHNLFSVQFHAALLVRMSYTEKDFSMGFSMDFITFRDVAKIFIS